MSETPTRRRTAAATAVLCAGLLLGTAACGGGSGGSGHDEAGGGGSGGSGGKKVTLTFWDWDPNMGKVVATWNAAHPDIQVKLSNPAGGDQLVAKMITAHAAGNGPDIAKVEYQSLPALVAKGVVRDITDYTGNTVKDYDRTTLSSAEFQGKVYGVPQDFAPLMLFYRADLFKKYGLAVPRTWDQYAAEARALRGKDPAAHLTNFDAADPGWFTGLAQQAGADWWAADGNSWKVDIDGAATRKVAGFWQQMVKDGSVAKNPSFSPEWNKQMNDGSLLTWISGAWAPAQLGGIAPATKGKWAVAPLPAWTAGDPATGIWGGSATTVTTDSAHPRQAAQFASWLNTDATALTEQVKQINIYPAATSGRSLPVLKAAPAFFPNQPDFYDRVAQVASGARSFPMWGPNVTVTFTGYTDAFSKALQSGGSFSGALTTIQRASVADMKKQGFTVG
ncbi:carbohydrate ABC transporter substrate-binding protein, CUT1 family [Actinacidiphila yanglinensis]|uniref:Carbohydrate ABC transporter substrate-binding protein, CUT1 family n=1 Tax=Actinacidiphila yanglinensis TaxID=310779 RepID=A0A1H6CWZ4_9ACTN|nr:sugar ABC transporter substrate-binding protein [Actinacidiphila yanglinensis]SEG77308.1 carbohydrate ABC transporter substrate-binding protein, CUT1 family [Actinacidiphila yanglinensis]